MDDSKHNISQIRKYLNGELDARAMHKLEREAQDDPFLMDALEGYEQSGKANIFDFNELDNRLDDRIGAGKVRRMVPWKYYAAAASVLLFFTVGYLVWPKPEVETKPVADLVVPQAAADHVEAKDDTIIKPQIDQAIAANRKRKLNLSIKSQPVIASAERGVLNQPPVPLTNAAPEPVADSANYRLAEVSVAANSKSKDSLINNAPALSRSTLAKIYNSGTATTGAKTYGTMGYSSAGRPNVNNLDTTNVKEIVIPGLAKLTPDIIAAAQNKQPQTLDNRVKDAKVKTPDKGHDAILSQAGLALTKDLPVPSKKDANPDKTAEASIPAYGQARAKSYAARASGKDDEVKTIESTTSSGLELKPDNIKKAHPKMGWDGYNKYLKARAVGDRGTIRLSFNVDAKGQLSDFKVVKSVNDATDSKAIDLVKNGPSWAPDVSGIVTTVELKIVFTQQ